MKSSRSDSVSNCLTYLISTLWKIEDFGIR